MGLAYHDLCYIRSVFSNGEWYSMWAYSTAKGVETRGSYIFLFISPIWGGLSSILSQATEKGNLSGVPTSKRGLV